MRSACVAGLLVSAAFNLQRALASELALLVLAHVFVLATVDYVVYLAVGAVMVAAGVVIVRRGQALHIHLPLLRLHSLEPGDIGSGARALSAPRP